MGEEGGGQRRASRRRSKKNLSDVREDELFLLQTLRNLTRLTNAMPLAVSRLTLYFMPGRLFIRVLREGVVWEQAMVRFLAGFGGTSPPLALLLSYLSFLFSPQVDGFSKPPQQLWCATHSWTRSKRAYVAKRPKLLVAQAESEGSKEGWWKPRPEWRDDDPIDVPGQAASELPDSFDDALNIAVESAQQAFAAGRNRVRIDFDTTAGDLTYTTLKNSIPLALALAQYLGKEVMEEDKVVMDAEGKKAGYEGKRLVVVFPDTGSAVWVEQDWRAGKLGSSAKVPPSVRCAAFPNEMVDSARDSAFLIVCPRASEAPATYELLTSLPADAKVVLLNPELINAEVVGFGMAGRRIRDEVENKFERAYYLKTLSWGALTRRWPGGYSIWMEDEGEEEGYRLLKTVGRFPSLDEMEDIRDAADMEGGENRGVLSGLARFIDSFKRM